MVRDCYLDSRGSHYAGHTKAIIVLYTANNNKANQNLKRITIIQDGVTFVLIHNVHSRIFLSIKLEYS